MLMNGLNNLKTNKMDAHEFIRERYDWSCEDLERWSDAMKALPRADFDNVIDLMDSFAEFKQERSYSEEEKDLLNKMFNLYWYENNNEHEDNLEEWELSKRLFNKL